MSGKWERTAAGAHTSQVALPQAPDGHHCHGFPWEVPRTCPAAEIARATMVLRMRLLVSLGSPRRTRGPTHEVPHSPLPVFILWRAFSCRGCSS